MKSTIYYRLAVAFVIAGLLAACSAASPDEDKKARLDKLKKEQAELSKEISKLESELAKENPEANVRAREVDVTEIKPRAFDHYVQTQGRIESENNILISAKSPGAITQVFVTEGEQVAKGQVLAQIDNSVIVQSIKSMESQLELAKSVFERQENLWKQKIGTEVQYLQAKTGKESLEKQIASLREQNEMYKIKSAIAGTVDEIHVKVGENIAPGMPAFRVVNGNDMKLIASISEAYISNIKKGNKVLINVPELGKELEAKVTFVGRTIDQLSRTFNIEVKLPNKAEIRPNMTATVKVVFASEAKALVVPVNIIQQINDEKIVYVAEANGKNTVAKKKVVTVDGVFGSFAQVKGLNEGDKVVTVGFQGLNEGDFIKI